MDKINSQKPMQLETQIITENQYSKYFLEKKDITFAQVKFDENVFNKIKGIIKDKNYFDFLTKIGNGGLFFKQSLHLYSFNSEENFLGIEYVNNVIKTSYGSLFNNLFTFAQDIFGNQFAFDLTTEKVTLFNCETGEKEVLADDFNGWLAILFKELDYYAGITYSEAWVEKNKLEPNQRLVPIKPFIIGGDYSIDNFYALYFPKYLTYNADIAKQIFNLKDGEKVKITYTKP